MGLGQMANLFNKPISTNPPTALEIKQSEQLVQVCWGIPSLVLPPLLLSAAYACGRSRSLLFHCAHCYSPTLTAIHATYPFCTPSCTSPAHAVPSQPGPV